MRRNLQDMVTVITGASAGIGKALAIELSGRGARLVLAARRLEKLDALNLSLGGGHLCVPTDVSRPDQCEELISRTIEHFGRIDTLVCNAGFGFLRGFDQLSQEEIRQIYDTNFFGTTECARHAVQAMKEQKFRDGCAGQIMIVSSACARRGLPYFSIYASTKAAQLSLAEGLRVELKPVGIKVTSVHPQICESDFFETTSDLSGMTPSALAPGRRQSVQTVAHHMVKAIENPKRECWPHPFSSLGLTIAVAIPAVVDVVMSGMRDRFVKENQASGALPKPAADPAPTMRSANSPAPATSSVSS